ncbi:hypothetical protein CAL7716_102680 (plasmid) [Calothrix sp. PCC 7716]|nr:hypothetical protein CAL7716_102680 [Calothrix sp. PCC 7716]
MTIKYFERVYTGHGEVYECFYEMPKTNGIHIAEDIGDKLPNSERLIYLAVFGNYYGVGSCRRSALMTLRNCPKKFISIDSKTWFGAAEQTEMESELIKIWIKARTLLWTH